MPDNTKCLVSPGSLFSIRSHGRGQDDISMRKITVLRRNKTKNRIPEKRICLKPHIVYYLQNNRAESCLCDHLHAFYNFLFYSDAAAFILSFYVLVYAFSFFLCDMFVRMLLCCHDFS